MAIKQLSLPANRVFNTDGLGIPGASATLYVTGTTTPATFYSDSGLTVGLGSVITADSIGRFTPLPYGDETIAYRLIIKDASGATLDDIDPYYFGLMQGVSGAPGASYPRTVTQQAGTTYTAVLGDTDSYIQFTNASPVTFTIPTNASVAFPIGTVIEIEQNGAGSLTVTGAGGVTIHSRGGVFVLQGQYGVASIKKVATDIWTFTGDL